MKKLLLLLLLFASTAWADSYPIGTSGFNVSGINLSGVNLSITKPYVTFEWDANTSEGCYMGCTYNLCVSPTASGGNTCYYYQSGISGTSVTVDTIEMCRAGAGTYYARLQTQGIGNSSQWSDDITIPCADAPLVIVTTTSSSTSSSTTSSSSSTTSSTESTTTTTTLTSELDEGFETAPLDAKWTASANINAHANISGLGTPPAAAGTYGVRCNSTGGTDYVVWNNGSDLGSTATRDITFSIYFDTLSTITNYGTEYIVGFNNSSSNGYASYVVSAIVGRSNSTYSLKMAAASGQSSSTTILEDTWYTVTIHLATGTDASYFNVGGGNIYFTHNDPLSVKYMWIGSLYGGKTLDFYVGNIKSEKY